MAARCDPDLAGLEGLQEQQDDLEVKMTPNYLSSIFRQGLEEVTISLLCESVCRSCSIQVCIKNDLETECE